MSLCSHSTVPACPTSLRASALGSLCWEPNGPPAHWALKPIGSPGGGILSLIITCMLSPICALLASIMHATRHIYKKIESVCSGVTAFLSSYQSGDLGSPSSGNPGPGWPIAKFNRCFINHQAAGGAPGWRLHSKNALHRW